MPPGLEATRLESASSQQSTLIRRHNIYEEVVEEIKRYIVDNGLAPGDRLPTESELAERFGVSRLTVREAIKVLESLGIIQSRTRDGMRLRAFTLKPMTDHLRFVLEAEKATVVEIAQARQVLETSILPVVAQNVTAADFEEMEAAIMALDAAITVLEAAEEGSRSPVAVSEADMRFHLALLRASRNRALEGFGSMLQEFFRHIRGERTIQPEHLRRSLDEHRGVVAALRTGDAESAQRIMERHLRVYDRYVFGERVVEMPV